jgi:hypothetical protein
MMASDSRRYLLPVRDLTLTREWLVGRVRLLPTGATRPLIAGYREGSERRFPEWYDRRIDEGVAGRFDESTVAEVSCAEPEAAYEHVADALAVLRLLQHQQSPTVDTDWQTFGLPGQVAQWHVEFLNLTNGASEGFLRGGAQPGWEFSDDDHSAFQADSGLQFLSHALAKDDRTRLEQRAVLAARLLSASTLEQDPDQKLLAAVMAVEVLLGDDDSGPQKFRLARRHAFLTCLAPTGDMCGRDRPSCRYLALDPANSAQRQQITALVDQAQSDVGVRCTMYLDVINLYNARSRAVHEGTVGADLPAVRNALYPVYRWMVPEALRWYAACVGDDLQALDEEIARVARERPPGHSPDQAAQQLMRAVHARLVP